MNVVRNIGRVLIGVGAFYLGACQDSRPAPEIVLWAWERPENLEFIDSPRISVAFLAQTIELSGDAVVVKPRRQSLKVPPATKLIAVTRIETEKKSGQRVTFSEPQLTEIRRVVLKSLELKNVSAIQLDFDVTVSEREGYRQLLTGLRRELPPGVGLTMTALASWCAGDNWIRELPVDEAVPMAFDMGADDKNVRDFLASGQDWTEPLCRQSYGLSIDQPLKIRFRPNRRFYLFTADPNGWEKSDLDRLDWLNSR